FPQNHEFIFTGRIPPHKALEYYNLFDIQVLPSITEGLSQTLLESMYMEVPVIATDAMGNPDLVVHNETGYLFQDENLEEMAQYIRTLFQDKKIYKKMAQKAKDRVMKYFTIETVINNYETFFQELIG
ncbi:MAG: glycosyltransferase family 4 protein, partial [Bacteroidales bacterium]|nr:glycosyltransferase family 4 protein [Bacteroidales bacterium]